MPEPVPLLEEIVAAVVTDLVDQLTVHVADLADVRRIDHHFAAVGNRRLGLVGPLRRDPQVVVHRRHHRDDLVERLVHPHDVPA